MKYDRVFCFICCCRRRRRSSFIFLEIAISLAPSLHLLFIFSMRRALFVVALSALAMLGGTGTAPFAAAAGSEGPFPAPDAVNAPPAAATLVLLGTAARVDRAADSGSRIRVTLEGCPPVAASISATQQQHLGRPPPQAVSAPRALAALPARAPATLVATGADGAAKTLIFALAGPPQVVASQEDNSTAAITIALEGDIVDEPKDVTLAKGAAAASLHAPGRLTRSTVPGRLAFDEKSGAALYIDVRQS